MLKSSFPQSHTLKDFIVLLKKTILMLSAAFAAHSVQAAIFDAAQCADLSKTEGVNSAKWIQAGKLPSDDQASFTGAAKSAAGVEFDAHCVVNGELKNAQAQTANLMPSAIKCVYPPTGTANSCSKAVVAWTVLSRQQWVRHLWQVQPHCLH